MSERGERDDRSDQQLIEATREGDVAAYEVLWQRHRDVAMVAARANAGLLDPEDIVQEAFARTFQAIRCGKGPTLSFRPYLYAAIRNIATTWKRRHIDTPGDLEDVETVESADEVAVALADQQIATTAFAALPKRWQEVLWLTEVEGMGPTDAAQLLGISPNATRQLSHRAREGLRDAYVQAHLQEGDVDDECAWVQERLGSFSRRTLSRRQRLRVQTHLAECPDCPQVEREAQRVSRMLPLVLLPIALGGGTAVAAAGTLPTSEALAAGTAPAQASGASAAHASGHAAATAHSTHAATMATASHVSTGMVHAIIVVKVLMVGVGALIGFGAFGAIAYNIEFFDLIEQAVRLLHVSPR
ncbi:sigma-70 family RNA polymerase sigma factor [Microbacterium sediminicola]